MSADWSKIAKFAGMLGSSGDGEIVNAARLIGKELARQNLTWADFKARLEGGARAPGPQPRSPWPEQPGPWNPAWEEKMRQEEEKTRQKASRRRKGREW